MKTQPSTTRIPSPAAQKAVAALALASRLYVHFLTDDERDAWRAYAATQTAIDPRTQIARPRQGDKVFVGLTCRFQRVNPLAREVPRLPPAYPFAGNKVSLTARAVAGGVEWTASGPTTADVRVELLLQRLASPARMPHAARYRTQAFGSFAEAGETFQTPIMRGWYVPAFRFICTETGQDTPLVVLPKVTVTE